VWEAAQAGRWDRRLAEAACAPIDADRKPAGSMEDHCPNPAIFLVDYKDGTQGAALMLDGYVETLAYAANVGGEISGTEFYLQDGDPHSHFSYLSLNIQEMFLSGVPTYPVERTLLTSGVLEAALDSRYRGHIPLATPYLDIQYQSYDSIPWRPRGLRPTGACLLPFP
jgi:hypothetical protein